MELGKSTLSKVIAGHEDYTVESGEILLDGQSILGQEPDEIAHAGVFLAFQYPMEIPGVSIANFIRAARAAPEGEEINAVAYYKELYEKMDALKMDRFLPAAPSTKASPVVRRNVAKSCKCPCSIRSYCVMDETDSGLDIDALRIVSEGVNMMRGEDRGFLVITHYQRLLDYIVPDVVHVMFDGRIVHSGDAELAKELESKGYDWVKAGVRLRHRLSPKYSTRQFLNDERH